MQMLSCQCFHSILQLDTRPKEAADIVQVHMKLSTAAAMQAYPALQNFNKSIFIAHLYAMAHAQCLLQCLCGILASAEIWCSVHADYYEEEGGEGEHVEEDAEALEEYEEGADEGGILL